jgi:non-ribosomal peptide synthetase component E (peptide arylation enzyme)
VVVRPGAEFDSDASGRLARVALPPYKVPKQVLGVDALPRNPVGKVDRERLAGS